MEEQEIARVFLSTIFTALIVWLCWDKAIMIFVLGLQILGY